MPIALLHGLTLAHPEALYLLAIPAIVLLWGIINAREVRRVFAPLMRAAALALFVIALANPQRVMHSEGAARPVIVDASSIRASAGVGVSWKSPVGPIRLDLGLPIKKESFDKTQFFHVSFGTRF